MSLCPIRQEWPESYWHIRSDAAVVNDLRLNRLLRDIVMPLRSGALVTSNGDQCFKPTDNMRVVRTAHPLAFYSEKLKKQCGFDVTRTGFSDARFLPFIYEGEDLTEELLYTNELRVDVGPGCRSSLDVVIRICERLGETARVLSARRHRPYVITDESDVRDLLHASLKSYCEDAVIEEPLPKVAGSNSAKTDVSIKSLGALIEVKLARGGLDQKRFVEELTIDEGLYSSWAHLHTLILVIFDSKLLSNPEGLREHFDGERERDGRRFTVRVALV